MLTLDSLTHALSDVDADVTSFKKGIAFENIRGGSSRSREQRPPPEVQYDLHALDDGGIEFTGVGERRPGAYHESASVGESDDTVHRISFQELPGNGIHESLGKLDKKRATTLGLRRFDAENGVWVPWAGTPSPGRVLLFIHGTFSNTENMLGEHGLIIAAEASRGYEHVLSFDYPTMCQTAIASAISLCNALRPFNNNPIDVVSHSQGGLVVRFWLELMERRRLADTRAVFVAGTLGGTSLAAPPAMRKAFSLVATIASVATGSASVLGTSMPLLGYICAVVGAVQKVTGFLKKSPVLDAGVAVVPGFQGMSRVGTNASLAQLQASVIEPPPGYFAVTGDFQPEFTGSWRFWKNFVARTKNKAADHLFQGPNDLVVDTESQSELSRRTHRIPTSRCLRYTPVPTSDGTKDDLIVHGNDSVHHTNYFEQPRVVEFVLRSLKRS